jgi:hypothetical protein
VGGYDGVRWGSFAHTVLVDMRERLRRSADPERVFTVVLDTARAAGLVGRRRVLDSTPLYDAVTTMDTVTLMRSAIRGLLRVADAALAAEVRAVLSSGDDYASAAKPQIDWDDADARAALIESRARDAEACLALLGERALAAEVSEAITLLATVTGQDLDTDADGHVRIARRVAKDRVISTVDPEARHGHKTAAHRFDGYKGHIAIDPDSEIITAAVVTAGNAGDASVAAELISEVLADARAETPTEDAPVAPPAPGTDDEDGSADRVVVYGDQAYGSGAFQQLLADAGIESRCKTQRPSARGDMLTKEHFTVDLDEGRVTCPAAFVAVLRSHSDGRRVASFGAACSSCPLQPQCTTASGGRTIAVGPHEAVLALARARQTDPLWRADYRSTRPKVERKGAHLVRRKHGGRHARMRGQAKVGHDFRWLAAAVNLVRMAVMGLQWRPTGGWTTGGWAFA